MSLITDAIFVQALRSNSALMQQLADGDVYNTTIALPDEELDNAELPYIIVSFDGFTNEGSTKDNAFEGDTDRVTVSIEVAAETRPQLGQIMRSHPRNRGHDHVTYLPYHVRCVLAASPRW